MSISPLLNPNMKELVMEEMLKVLKIGIIYSISDSRWVNPIHVVPKKGGMTIIENNKGEIIPNKTTTRWRVCIDYYRLNKATRKDHFPLLFINEMLERLAKLYNPIFVSSLIVFYRFHILYA